VPHLQSLEGVKDGQRRKQRMETNLNQQLSFHSKFEVVDEEKKRVSFILSDETIVDRGWFSMQFCTIQRM